jgi:hypothetical protein
MLFFYPKKVAKRLGDRGYHAAEIVPLAEGIHRSSHHFNLAKSVQSFNKPGRSLDCSPYLSYISAQLLNT